MSNGLPQSFMKVLAITLASTTAFAAVPFGRAAHATADGSTIDRSVTKTDVSAMVEKAEKLSSQGRYADAAAIWQQILSMAEKLLGPDHPDVALSLNNLALLLGDQGMYNAAEPLLRRALVIREKTLGPDHPLFASSLNNLADILSKQGKYTTAEQIQRRSLGIYEKALGSRHPDVALSLGNLALLLSSQGKYTAAELLIRQSLTIYKKILTADHPTLALSLNNLADILAKQGKYTTAEPIQRRSLSIYEKAMGHDHPVVAISLNNLAANLSKQGQYAAAGSMLRRSLAIREKTLSLDHPDVGLSLNNLAGILREQGQYTEAESIQRRSLSIYEKSLGPDHPNVALSLNNLAQLVSAQGQYAAAELIQRRSLGVYEKSLGPDHPNVALSLANLAQLLSDQGHYASAESLLRRSLAIREKSLGPDHPDVAHSLNNLASSLSDQGKYSAAEVLFRRSLAIREKALGADHPYIAISLNNLANILNGQGQYSAAGLMLRRSLANIEKALGSDHPNIAISLNNLANLLKAQGQYAAAEPLYRRSLAIREKTLGPDHPDFGNSLNNLAELLSAQGQYAAAEALHRRSLAIREKTLGPDHPDFGNSLNNLAQVLSAQGQYAAAEALHRRSLAISEKALGLAHPNVAITLNNLALLLMAKGQYVAAEPLLRRALAIKDKSLGAVHPDVASSHGNLAGLLMSNGKYENAILSLTRSLAIDSTFLLRELPLLPDQARTAQLRQLGSAWQWPFGMIDRYFPAATLALETRLNRHGLLPEIEQSQALLMNAANIEPGKVEQLRVLTQRLASVSMPPESRTALREQRDKLQAEIYRQIPDLQIQLVTPAQVAKSLPADGVLVEFQRFQPYNGRKPMNQRWGAAQYIALVLKPDGSISAVPLGSASEVDDQVHKGLVASAGGFSDAEAIWAQLSNQVLKPLLPHLKGSRQWFLSPDGELNRVPFAALPSPQQATTPLGQAVQLRLLTTGRELLRLKQPSASSGKAVVMANPSYDRLSTALTAPSPVDTSINKGQRRSAEVGSKNWEPLPGSEREGLQVAQLLNSKLVSGSAATTTSLKGVQGPRVLHIATHGFFVADQESPPNDPLRVLQEQNFQLEGLRQEDPQLRSGLVLAGANQPTMDPNDDGYLTAAEAVTLNLKGTELVVLSACSTGQGEVRTGEGVYGLQRSLTVAGARSTLLSLWKVDDAATAAFMTSFYKRLKAGEGRSDALAAVQKEFKEGPFPAWQHPYYWAAWQLVGDWRPIKDL